MKATVAILLAACLQISASGAVQGGARVVLEPSVVAHGDVVSVSDLLPADASPNLHSRAASVVVGDSPLPGTRRTFRNSEVEQALRGTPELRSAVEIPPAVEVTRWSRLLSAEELLAAVTAGISGSRQFQDTRALTLADLSVMPAVLVTEDAPKIEITRFELGLNGMETRMRLWIPSEPRLAPFWVTLRCVLNTNPTTAKRLSQEGNASTKPHVSPSAVDSIALIRAGERVQLVMLAAGMRITTPATALERGSEGQKIRVRSIPAGKPLLATVVSAQLVEVDY